MAADPPRGFDRHQPVIVECLGRNPRYDPDDDGMPVWDQRMEYGPGASRRVGRDRAVKFRHLRCLAVQYAEGREVIRRVDRWGLYELHVTGPGYRSFKDPEGPRPFLLTRLR